MAVRLPRRSTQQSMQYPHSPERSTELLRQALPLMSRQSAALHPMSYAVWYAYVADSASPLRQAVDRHLAQRGTLDEATTERLYQHYLASDFDPQVALRVSEGLQQLIGGMSAQAALATDQTSRYGLTLERMAAELAQRGQGLEHVRGHAQPPDALKPEGQIQLVGGLETLPLSLGQKRKNQALAHFAGKLLERGGHQLAVDAQHGRSAHGQMKVGSSAFMHQQKQLAHRYHILLRVASKLRPVNT